jgi:hypothetical protein
MSDLGASRNFIRGNTTETAKISEGELVNSIRASVAFTSPESHCEDQAVIFTIHAKDIESLIRGSLRTYFELTGKKLNPVVKTKKSN